MLATTVVFFAACILTPAAVHVLMRRHPIDARAAFEVRSPAHSFA